MTSEIDTTTESKKFFITTFGCQMNVHDSERIAGQLLEDGYTEATSEAEADVIVLNTCCIRENADKKLYGTVGTLSQLKETNPNLQIAVGGCLAQKDRDLILKKLKSVDVVFGTHNIDRVTDLLHENEITREAIIEIIEEHEAYPSALPAKRDSEFSAWVTIQIKGLGF